jgi:hypothetical protein
MKHTTAINVLSDELDDIQKDLEQHKRRLAALMTRKVLFHEKIREDAIIRLQRTIKDLEDKWDSIKASVKVLEGLTLEYGFRGYNGEIMSLEGIDFSTARDLCEVSGTQLMRKNDNGEWEEA